VPCPTQVHVCHGTHVTCLFQNLKVRAEESEGPAIGTGGRGSTSMDTQNDAKVVVARSTINAVCRCLVFVQSPRRLRGQLHCATPAGSCEASYTLWHEHMQVHPCRMSLGLIGTRPHRHRLYLRWPQSNSNRPTVDLSQAGSNSNKVAVNWSKMVGKAGPDSSGPRSPWRCRI
jgi:hypothetical protein